MTAAELRSFVISVAPEIAPTLQCYDGVADDGTAWVGWKWASPKTKGQYNRTYDIEFLDLEQVEQDVIHSVAVDRGVDKPG